MEIEYRPHGHLPIVDRVGAAVEELIGGFPGDGDVLVFLPGAEEIRRVGRRLETMAAREGLDVLPLHGSLAIEEQTLALRPSSRRKMILATNIAETSLTIEGVKFVVDSGLARVAMFDSQRGLDRLELKQISKASAVQRAGARGANGAGALHSALVGEGAGGAGGF